MISVRLAPEEQFSPEWISGLTWVFTMVVATRFELVTPAV